MFYLPNSPLMIFFDMYFYYKVDYVETDRMSFDFLKSDPLVPKLSRGMKSASCH